MPPRGSRVSQTQTSIRSEVEGRGRLAATEPHVLHVRGGAGLLATATHTLGGPPLLRPAPDHVGTTREDCERARDRLKGLKPAGWGRGESLPLLTALLRVFVCARSYGAQRALDGALLVRDATPSMAPEGTPPF